MRICGSCHTLVSTAEDPDIWCPRCFEALDPDSESILKRFVELGVVEYNRKGGVTLNEAQKAASELLDRFSAIQLEILVVESKLTNHHDGGKCGDCEGER